MTGARDVAVCVVTRNRSRELRKCLVSCLAQSGVSSCVRVFDNGSEDGTRGMLELDFGGVVVVRSEINVWAAPARNRLVGCVSEPLVVFLDDDSYFTDRGTLAEVVRRFGELPDEAICLAMRFANSRPTSSHRVGDGGVEAQDGERLRNFVGCACAFRREALVEVGGFDDSIGMGAEELELCLRMELAGREVRYARTPVVVHDFSESRSGRARLSMTYRNVVRIDWQYLPMSVALAKTLKNMVNICRYRPLSCDVSLRDRASMAVMSLGGAAEGLGRRSGMGRSVYRAMLARRAHEAISWDGAAPGACGVAGAVGS